MPAKVGRGGRGGDEERAQTNTRGSIILGDLIGKITMLEIVYRRCDHRGLLRLDRLIEEHGVGMGLPVRVQLQPRSVLHLNQSEYLIEYRASRDVPRTKRPDVLTIWL